MHRNGPRAKRPHTPAFELLSRPEEMHGRDRACLARSHNRQPSCRTCCGSRAAGQQGIDPTAAARCAGAKSSATRLAVGEIPSPSTMRARRTSPGQAGVAPFRQAGCTGQPEFHQPSAPRAPERLLLGSQWHALQPKPGATWPETAAAVLGQPGFANLCQT